MVFLYLRNEVSLCNQKNEAFFLTSMLVFAAFGILSSLFTFTNTNSIQLAYGSIPSWYYPYVIFAIIIGVVNIVGIWIWKKWAVFTLAVTLIISIQMELFVVKPIQPGFGILGVLLAFVGAGLWFWAIYRKWKYFE